MKIIPITILKIIIFLFLLSSSSIAFAQDKESKSSPPKTGDGIATTAPGTLLDGDWTVKEFRVTGAYSGGAKQEALEALGKTVRFNSGDALLYDGQHCVIESAKQIEIDDTGTTFGSWGGSYKEIGLKPIPGKDNHYQVEEINLKCEKGEETRRVWIANDGDLILLSVWETWVQLEKLTFSP